MNIMGDFSVADTDNFYYEIYFSKPNGSSESEHKYASAGETVTFQSVTYDTYNFYLKVWIDKNKNTTLDTITMPNTTVSAQNNKVQFPDMHTSDYAGWFFVGDEEKLVQTLTTINAENSRYNVNNKAKICLTKSIQYSEANSLSENEKLEIINNGYEISELLYSITITSTSGGTVEANTESASEGTEITMTVNSDSGYRFSIYVTDADGEPIELGDDGDNICFNMPPSNVTIKVIFYDAIYVDGVNGSSENDGLTASTALEDISAALDKISDIDDGEWTIKIIGTLATTGVTLQNISAESLVIEGVDSGTVSGNNQNRVFLIKTSVPITLKNLTISEGFCNSENGGGILISDAAADVTLDGCVVKENSVTNASGAGICVAYSGSSTSGSHLTLKDTSVTDNTVIHSDAVVIYSGAGIMIENVNMTLDVIGNSDISSNKIDCSTRTGASFSECPEGAGFFLGNSATTTIEDYVTVNANNFTLSTTDGAKSQGGGMYIKGGTLNVANIGNFIGNSATEGKKIYFGGTVNYNNGTKSDGEVID